jgi:lysophospholipase L1-like esterase
MPMCFNEDSFYDFLQTGEGSHARRKILIEEDSWVSHPQLHNLSRALDYNGDGDYGILNVASPGVTAHEVFHKRSPGLRRLHRVIKTSRYGFTFDMIMFSAGGNDIIGPEIRSFLLHKKDNPGKNGFELIDDDKFNSVIDHIIEDYRRIIDVIRASSANADTQVITHTYSYLVPRETGTHFGDIMFSRGWVARYMDEDKGIRDSDEQQEIIQQMLVRFHNGIVDLQQEYYNFLAVDTLATLSVNGKPDTSLFHDEIHPNLRGFKKVFRRIKSVARRNDLWLD